MEKLLEKHPDIKKHLINCPTLHTYKIFDSENKLAEQWEKNDEGHWIDVTEREKLREQIAMEQEEIERLSNKLL